MTECASTPWWIYLFNAVIFIAAWELGKWFWRWIGVIH
jgi:hypothetical protein